MTIMREYQDANGNYYKLEVSESQKVKFAYTDDDGNSINIVANSQEEFESLIDSTLKKVAKNGKKMTVSSITPYIITAVICILLVIVPLIVANFRF